MSKKIFKAASLSDERAQKYGEFLWKLKEDNGEVLKPSFVVKKAKPKSSPIHDFFEWDDKVASLKYREWQARYLLGEIEVVEIIDDKEEKIRAFHNLTITDAANVGLLVFEALAKEDCPLCAMKSRLQRMVGKIESEYGAEANN
jgi:hypothetical protein